MYHAGTTLRRPSSSTLVKVVLQAPRWLVRFTMSHKLPTHPETSSVIYGCNE